TAARGVEKMTPCDPLKNRLVEFALGGLGRGKARRLERHLRECRGCTAELERLRDRTKFSPAGS
ncbi:MAG: zf-HC2 domain-containing protein, partial [Acidobacteria bacterium]|nr:zf-HC2 domain-containing protein [Acidobacteriota bacterium]